MYMYNFSDWVKPENFSIDWLQGIFQNESSVTSLLSSFARVGLDPNQWVFHADYHSCYYKNLLCYGPAGDDIRIWFNADDYTPIFNETDFRYIYDHEPYSIKLELGKKSDLSVGVLVPSLTLTSDHRYNQHIFISISGDGCRFLRQQGIFNNMLTLFKELHFRCSRIDVALDIFDSNNYIVDHVIKSFDFIPGESDYMVTTPMSRIKNLKSWNNVHPDMRSTSLSFGNHGSNSGMMRLYDKLHEMRYGRSSCVTSDSVADLDYWYRFEFEAHHEFAESIFNFIIDCKFNLAPSFVIMSNKIFKIRVANWNCENVHTYSFDEFYESFLSYIEQNIEFEATFDLVKRSKSVDSYKLYLFNMAKTFYAIQTLLDSTFITEQDHYLNHSKDLFEGSPDLQFRIRSLSDLYRGIGQYRYLSDSELQDRLEYINIGDFFE